MARRLGFKKVDVIDAAIAIANEHGIEALTLARVAAQLGVRPPSLLHHVSSLQALRREIALVGAARLRAALVKSARGLRGRDALLAFGRAYRQFAQEQPGAVGAMLPAPRPGEDDELYRALAAPVIDIGRVLADLGLLGDAAIDAIRALRSYLHGFIDLERRGGFGMPQNIDKSFERGLEILVNGLLP